MTGIAKRVRIPEPSKNRLNGSGRFDPPKSAAKSDCASSASAHQADSLSWPSLLRSRNELHRVARHQFDTRNRRWPAGSDEKNVAAHRHYSRDGPFSSLHSCCPQRTLREAAHLVSLIRPMQDRVDVLHSSPSSPPARPMLEVQHQSMAPCAPARNPSRLTAPP